jgi:hypothetical protein
LYKQESCPRREDDTANPGEWNCETDMFEAEGGYIEASGMKWIEEYDGLPAYPEKYYSFNVNGHPHALECYAGNSTTVQSEGGDTCPHPYARNPDILTAKDHGTTDKACIMQCPTPIFTEGELLQQWLAFIIPGVMAFIPSVVVAGGWTTDSKLTGRNVSPVQALGIVALLVIVVGTLPSAIWFTNLVCVTATEYDKGSSALCWINRAEPFFAQILFGLITVHVYALYDVVVGGNMDGVAAVMKKFGAFRWVLAAVPVLVWTIWIYYYSTQKDEIVNANPAYATAIQQVNQIRETFRCAPLFPSVELEFVLMYAPGILYSASCLFFTTGILMATARAGRSIESLRSVHGRTMKGHFKLYKTLVFRSLDASKLSLLLLAVGCSMIFVLQIVSTAHLFPQFEKFGSEAQEWATCNLSIAFCGSINTEMRTSDYAEDSEISFILRDCARWAIKYGEGQGCGPTPQNKPSHTIMVLASLGSSLLPLFVSLAFSHKTLRAMGRKVVASLKPTSTKPSAVNPVLQVNELGDCEDSYNSDYPDER